MAKKVAQMIEEQVQFWGLKNSPTKKHSSSLQKLPVITISREFGAKGAALASVLSEKMGFKVWDKELLDVISRKLGSNKDYMQAIDENRRSMLEDTFFAFMNQKSTNLNYFIYLVKSIRSIEELGNSIIVGRGGNFICRNPKSLHIRMVSPLDTRIEYISKKEGLTKQRATTLITQKDAERANFTKQNFNRDIDLSSNYDLVLNSASFPIETIAEIVSTAYTCKLTDKAIPKTSLGVS